MAATALRLVRGNPATRNARTLEIGAPLTVLIKAGAVERGTARTATKFVGTIQPGQAGLYQGPMLGKMGREGWHVVSVGAWDVPLHRSQFKPRRQTPGHNPATKETVWAVVEAARHALNIADAARDSGRPILFRIPVMGHKSLDGLLRGMLRDYDAPARRNPPRTVTVYPSLISIRARKGDGQEYVHKFATGTPVMGLPDGSVLLPARAGRPLWEYR